MAYCARPLPVAIKGVNKNQIGVFVFGSYRAPSVLGEIVPQIRRYYCLTGESEEQSVLKQVEEYRDVQNYFERKLSIVILTYDGA